MFSTHYLLNKYRHRVKIASNDITFSVLILSKQACCLSVIYYAHILPRCQKFRKLSNETQCSTCSIFIKNGTSKWYKNNSKLVKV